MKPNMEDLDMKRLRTENAQLKAENDRLKGQLAKPAPKSARPKRHVIRKISTIILVSASVALLTVANLLFWFGNTIVKNDRFVAATKPIINDPAIQESMALYTTNSIFSNTDVQGAIESALPPRADFLVPQLAGQLKSFTQTSIQKVLANPSFQTKWNDALSKQHQRLINFASKYQGDGDISLNDVYNNLAASLSGTKLAFLADKKLPPKAGDIKVISAPWLPAFHKLVTRIDTWRLLAVILLVTSVAGAAWLSRNRRRTLYIFSLASALMVLVTLIALHITRDRIVGKVDAQYSEGVGQALQIVLHPLVLQSITTIAAVLLVGIVAWVSSASPGAVALKNWVSSLFGGKIHSRIFKTGGPRIAWVQAHRAVLEWSIVAVVAAGMLLVRLTLKALLIYIFVMVLAILTVQVIGGKPGSTTRKLGT